MIIIDMYLCYYMFEPLLSYKNKYNSLSSLINTNTNTINTNNEILIIGVFILNFLSLIYELNIKNSIFSILFISLINICISGSVLFKYIIFPEEHMYFAIILFISILLYMIFSSSNYNYKLIYIQFILSGYCIWTIISNNDNDNNSDSDDIFLIEILLLLNFALFYLTRHFYIR